MWFNKIYCLFVFCCGVLALQTYGLPLSIRQIFAVIMFVCCFIKERKLWADKFFKIYLIFVVSYGLSCLTTGYFSEFLKRLIGDYFVAYVAIWATKILVKDLGTIKPLLKIIMFIGLLDGTITLFQFLGITVLDTYTNTLQLISYDRYLDLYQGTIMMDKCSPGIFSTPVLNAHVLILCTLLSLIPLWKIKYLNYIIWAYMTVCLFSTQQRTSFFLTTLFALYVIYKELGKSKYSFLLYLLYGFTLFWGIQYFIDFVKNGEFRFTELGSDDTGRNKIYTEAYEYICSHAFGGIQNFVNTSGRYPHNLFLNAFIYGGWLGGFVIIYIIARQIVIIFNALLKTRIDSNIIILACASLTMLGNGITHNLSIVNGEIFTFIGWTAFYYYNKLNSVNALKI